MDSMQGESRRIVCRDSETGESMECIVNRETGEHQNRETSQPIERAPRIDTGTAIVHESSAPQQPYQLHSSATSHRLLLIPASMIFPPVVSILLIMLEIYLHIGCHRKNKTLQNCNVYYQSPFHALTSRFCGSCRESHSALVVSHLQERRLNRYRYLKGLVS